MKETTIGRYDLSLISGNPNRICYVLIPVTGLESWFTEASSKYDLSIAIVSNMDWDNDLTPWPASGEPPGSPDFEGKAKVFMNTLLASIIPCTGKELNISPNAERTLLGVSLSGLFTLWQWMLYDEFKNIISLSGSFWYNGFAQWIKSNPVPPKKGKAYFLLGDKEAFTNVKAFQSVQRDTAAIVEYLKERGIDIWFEMVPGNHYQHLEQRLNRSLDWMFG